MKRRILDYRNRIDTLINTKSADTDWNSLLTEHLQQIAFFQHERLIHLIVTVTFAIMTLMSICVYLITEFIPLILLIALFFVLLIPYINHYYLLENEVQKMYKQYDEILKFVQQAQK
ncbi:MAG: hypothetical protein ACI4E1_12570 [Lachnospira sp.]